MLDCKVDKFSLLRQSIPFPFALEEQQYWVLAVDYHLNIILQALSLYQKYLQNFS